MINTLQKMGKEGTYLNIIKAMYDKPTANIILNSKKLKAFPLRSRTRQGCPLLPLLIFLGCTAWYARSYFPNQGSNLCPLFWELGVLTTGLPGKSLLPLLFNIVLEVLATAIREEKEIPEREIKEVTPPLIFIAALFTIAKTWKQPKCP